MERIWNVPGVLVTTADFVQSALAAVIATVCTTGIFLHIIDNILSARYLPQDGASSNHIQEAPT